MRVKLCMTSITEKQSFHLHKELHQGLSIYFKLQTPIIYAEFNEGLQTFGL